jgi:hypothetical protein
MEHVPHDSPGHIQQTFETREASSFAMKVSRRVQTAHLQNGLAAGLVPVKTATQVRLCQQIDVRGDLVLEIPV